MYFLQLRLPFSHSPLPFANLYSTSCFFLGPTSWFEVGSSSATTSDSASEAIAFFIRFDKLKTNDLDPADFCGAGAPYVDFYGFWVLGECITHLKAVYNSHGDFMQGFCFGRSVREHFLKLLGSVMNEIKHNFIDTVFVERILQWRPRFRS